MLRTSSGTCLWYHTIVVHFTPLAIVTTIHLISLPVAGWRFCRVRHLVIMSAEDDPFELIKKVSLQLSPVASSNNAVHVKHEHI